MNQEFLQPDIEQIKHQIRQILVSYSHEWDLIAELLQNAVDAIKAAQTQEGKILINIDSANRAIEVQDNGLGIEPAQVKTLLRPFGTNKAKNQKLVGEKGVGLKYVIFSSSRFELNTSTGSDSCNVVIEGASS